jgi:hypothetical protein
MGGWRRHRETFATRIRKTIGADALPAASDRDRLTPDDAVVLALRAADAEPVPRTERNQAGARPRAPASRLGV